MKNFGHLIASSESLLYNFLGNKDDRCSTGGIHFSISEPSFHTSDGTKAKGEEENFTIALVPTIMLNIFQQLCLTFQSSYQSFPKFRILEGNSLPVLKGIKGIQLF